MTEWKQLDEEQDKIRVLALSNAINICFGRSLKNNFCIYKDSRNRVAKKDPYTIMIKKVFCKYCVDIGVDTGLVAKAISSTKPTVGNYRKAMNTLIKQNSPEHKDAWERWLIYIKNVIEQMQDSKDKSGEKY